MEKYLRDDPFEQQTLVPKKRLSSKEETIMEQFRQLDRVEEKMWDFFGKIKNRGINRTHFERMFPTTDDLIGKPNVVQNVHKFTVYPNGRGNAFAYYLTRFFKDPFSDSDLNYLALENFYTSNPLKTGLVGIMLYFHQFPFFRNLEQNDQAK